MRKMDDQALRQAAGGRSTESDIDPKWTNLTREPHSAANCREFHGGHGAAQSTAVCSDCTHCVRIRLSTGQTQSFCKKGM